MKVFIPLGISPAPPLMLAQTSPCSDSGERSYADAGPKENILTHVYFYFNFERSKNKITFQNRNVCIYLSVNCGNQMS